jgi:hypothetical protein
MKKYVGNFELPNTTLKYYIFGDYRRGFGIRIVKNGEECADEIISRNIFRTYRLAKLLCRCSVFPGNLCEIVEDLRAGGPG